MPTLDCESPEFYHRGALGFDCQRFWNDTFPMEVIFTPTIDTLFIRLYELSIFTGDLLPGLISFF